MQGDGVCASMNPCCCCSATLGYSPQALWQEMIRLHLETTSLGQELAGAGKHPVRGSLVASSTWRELGARSTSAAHSSCSLAVLEVLLALQVLHQRSRQVVERCPVAPRLPAPSDPVQRRTRPVSRCRLLPAAAAGWLCLRRGSRCRCSISAAARWSKRAKQPLGCQVPPILCSVTSHTALEPAGAHNHSRNRFLLSAAGPRREWGFPICDAAPHYAL